MLILGASTGGLAAIASASNPPPGLLVAVNLAGGQMSDACARSRVETNLTAAFAAFGKRSRVPTLWVYSENDKVFPPQLTQRLRETYAAGGGKVEFVSAPPFGADGHTLFSGQWVSEWMPHVDQFLKQHELVWLEKPLPPPPLPQIPPPQSLRASGHASFGSYLAAPPNRAFAASLNGSYGWSAAQRTVEEAKKRALAGCAKHAKDCRIVVINEDVVPPPRPEIAPPPQLTSSGREAFEVYLAAPPQRAFAVSPNGSYGWQSEKRTIEEAKKMALDRCAKHASDCRIVVINEEVVP